MAMKRVNIRITDEMHKYFLTKSDKTGFSMSSLMSMALEEYMVQRLTLESLQSIQALQELQKELTQEKVSQEEK